MSLALSHQARNTPLHLAAASGLLSCVEVGAVRTHTHTNIHCRTLPGGLGYIGSGNIPGPRENLPLYY